MSCKTLSIGGATFDLFVRTGDEIRTDKDSLLLPLGKKVRVKQVIETCGGGANNTSVGLKRLGCDAHFCGIIGADQWGQNLLENLKKEGVNSSATTIVEGETTSFSLILSSESGERVILYEPGTNAHLHDATFDRETARGMQWLYLNHIHEHSSVIEDDIVAMLEANPDMGLTWNPGGSHIREGMKEKHNAALLHQTDLLLCNKEEAMMFTGETTMDAAADALRAAGARIVCISDGKNGSLGVSAAGRFRCPVVKGVKIIDSTGAGDAFGTAATWALLQGFPLPNVLRAGTINATSVIGAIGAQAGLLTDTQLHTQLSSVRLDVQEC
jgi:ribokinase